jgi:hypothetical protein
LVSTYFNAGGFQDGALSQAKFLGPLGYYADVPNERLFFTDAGNNRIRILQYFINRAPFCSFDTATISGLLEDQGLVNLPSIVSNLSAGTGPADSLQQVAFLVESVPSGKILNSEVDSSGSLRFQPAPDSNGVFQIKVVLKDNGGTADGGVDSSVYYKTVQVLAVNDAPRFRISGNDTAANGIPRKRPGFLLELSAGPQNESNQVLDTSIVCSNPDWFLVQPWFDGDTLKFEPAGDTLGTTQIRIQLKDNGGLANGGTDSLNTAFTITLVDPSNVKRWIVRPSLRIFPNPVRDVFQVSNLPVSCRSVTLFDLNGRELEEIAVGPDGFLRPSGNYSGTYLLHASGWPNHAALIEFKP